VEVFTVGIPTMQAEGKVAVPEGSPFWELCRSKGKYFGWSFFNLAPITRCKLIK